MPRMTFGTVIALTILIASSNGSSAETTDTAPAHADIALHKAVRRQAERVRQLELELQAAVEQVKPMLHSNQRVDFGVRLPASVAISEIDLRHVAELMHPVGARRELRRIRWAVMQVQRQRDYLHDLERALDRTED